VNLNNRGFSALELLITMALITILLALGVPGLRTYLQNQRIRATAASLHAELSLARNEAINLDQHVIACPGNAETGCAEHSNWHRGWLIFVDENDDRAWQTGEPLLRRTNEQPNVLATSASSRRQIRFFPGGSAPGSNAGIVICDHRGYQKGRKIVISNSGRIRQDNPVASDQAACMLP
jgi:type IV fimbrial biogenesis protein FimT